MDLADFGRWPGIADKSVLVTGASRGIGQAIAQGLARQGGKVVGTATTQEGADRITGRLSPLGGRGAVLNVTEEESVTALIKEMSGQEGSPLILVNNAGITRDNLIMRMKGEEWQEVLDTNLTAIYRLSKGCLRGMMKARFGRIINISSVVGLMGNPGQANYAAAKAGIYGFTKALAREVASRNVTVNAIAPGFIDTDMTRDLTDEQRAVMSEQIPLGRLGLSEDIAAGVMFLASDGAGYITGETLNINGGMLMP